MREANTVCVVKDWDRRPWHQKAIEGTETKLFRIEMIHLYEGIIEGEASIQYLFANNNGLGGYVALELVTGSVEGKSGSFVFQHTGTFANGQGKSTLVVLPGSGTGELSRLSGHAMLDSKEHSERYPLLFNYEL